MTNVIKGLTSVRYHSHYYVTLSTWIYLELEFD